MNVLTSPLPGIVWLLACWGLAGTVYAQPSSFAVTGTSVNGYEVGGFSIAPLSDTGEGYSGCASAAPTDPGPGPGPGPGPAPLPLLVTDLEAVRTNGSTVQLTWNIEHSEGDYHWVLERRLDVEDTFSEISELPTPLLLRRKYLDENAHAGASYYRVRGEAADGAVIYSPIRSVDNAFGLLEFRIYPSPLRQSARVQVPSVDRSYSLTLIDNLGREVWGGSYPARSANPVPLLLPALPPGVYLLRWTMEGVPAATIRVVVGY